MYVRICFTVPVNTYVCLSRSVSRKIKIKTNNSKYASCLFYERNVGKLLFQAWFRIHIAFFLSFSPTGKVLGPQGKFRPIFPQPVGNKTCFEERKKSMCVCVWVEEPSEVPTMKKKIQTLYTFFCTVTQAHTINNRIVTLNATHLNAREILTELRSTRASTTCVCFCHQYWLRTKRSPWPTSLVTAS
jgi:hypothetical protein